MANTENKKHGANLPNSEPSLRFPEFEGAWEKKKLKDLGSFFSGGTPKTTTKEFYEGEIPFIRSGEINANKTELKITEEGLKNSSAKMVSVGQILIALYGANSGSIALSKINGAINQAILCFNTEQNNQFFKNLWEANTDNILETFLQGGQGNLSAEIIKNIQFHFPKIQEQNKIAQLFELLESKINTQRKTVAELFSLMENLRDDLIEQKISFSDNAEKIKLRLGDNGFTYGGLSGKTKEDFGKGEKYIQYKQIFDNCKIDLNTCGLVTLKENERQNSAKYGDIFFTTSSETRDEIGMSSVFLEKSDKIYLNSFCFGYRLHSFEKLLPEFAQYFFRSKSVREKIKKLAQGSTRFNMSKNEFMKMEVVVPAINDQLKISRFLNAISEKIETEKQILKLVELQKKFLLKNLFV